MDGGNRNEEREREKEREGDRERERERGGKRNTTAIKATHSDTHTQGAVNE